MNQDEKLVNQSNWSGKRVVLIYWAAIIFLGTFFAVGLGTGALNPKFTFNADDPHAGFPEGTKWHPDDCAQCHSTQVDAWNETGHAHAAVPFNNGSDWVELAGVRNVSAALFDASCGHCMATGWDNSTGTVTYWDYGVTCAACHEPGVVNHTAANCGNCHTGSHHPQYPDYTKSAHSQSLDDLLASDHAGDYCLHCMSGQGTYTDELHLNDTFLTSISCATCHDPHDDTNEYQLRNSDVNELCGDCHSGSRHGAYDMLTDTETKSAHGNFDCTKCHGYQLNEDLEHSVNHTWMATTDGCSECHTNPNDRWTKMEEIQGDISTLLDEYDTQLENVTAKADAANETENVSEAKMNDTYALIDEAKALVMFVEGDGSLGFHNPDLAEEKLKLALLKLDEAYAKAEDAINTAGGGGAGDVPGFEAFTILGAISILAASVLFYRKRR
ncbi:MAG: ammonia-forming cytochrome c nitrite reductase subunit c552 [Candidatus Hodarchaeota archaeon]